MLKKLGLLLSLTALAVGVVCQSAFAAAQDYSSVTSGASAEIQAALTAALPIMGTVLAVFIALRVIRRVAK
ncbi:MAG: hypothetical protein ACJ762_11330 [Solirubrobacteraceae bacterium]